MIIVFSGIDGSGKTTCANFAYHHLKGKSLNVRYLHIIRDSFYHKMLHNLIGRVSKNTKGTLEKKLRTKESGVLSFFSKLAKKTALFINLALFNLRYGGYKGNIKRTVIVDRYFYDDIVQGMYLGIAGKRFLDAYKRLIILPDVIFFLDADPVKAYERKQEYDKDYYFRKSIIYKEVYGAIPHLEIAEGSMENINNIAKGHLDGAIKKYE